MRYLFSIVVIGLVVGCANTAGHILTDLNCVAALAADAAVAQTNPFGGAVQTVEQVQAVIATTKGLAPSTIAACAGVVGNIQEDVNTIKGK